MNKERSSMMELAKSLSAASDQLESGTLSPERQAQVGLVADILAMEVETELKGRGIDFGKKKTRKAKNK